MKKIGFYQKTQEGRGRAAPVTGKPLAIGDNTENMDAHTKGQYLLIMHLKY
jgi:hypothetical protein